MALLLPACLVWGQKQNALFESMLPSTAKVMFIDSTVVDKSDFLSAVPLPSDAGSMKAAGGDVSYVNELGNFRITAQGDSTERSLYASDRMGDSWGKARRLKELEADHKLPDYPFLLADGTTLFFAAKGAKSIGGYDIFVTTYNSDEGKYLEPQNYGLPYNSEANDYLLAFDELDSLGWLVTDRRQPKGKVCIYTFAMSQGRTSYGATDDSKLASLARIDSIRGTWKVGNRKKALARLSQLYERNRQAVSEADDIQFVINDQTTYHSIDDFRVEENKDRYQQLCALKEQLSDIRQNLETLRDRYHESSDVVRNLLHDSIVQSEQQSEQLSAQIKQLAKTIRNNEQDNLPSI